MIKAAGEYIKVLKEKKRQGKFIRRITQKDNEE